MLFEWAIKIVSVAPASLVLELLVLFDAPVDFPLPASVNRQQDRVFGQLDFTVLVTPPWALVRQEFVVEYTHPDALILVSFELSNLFIFKLLVIEIKVVYSAINRISPILLIQKAFFTVLFIRLSRILALVIECVKKVKHLIIFFRNIGHGAIQKLLLLFLNLELVSLYFH